jgi:hypothetical protein
MSDIELHSHWQNIYQTKGERDDSWFQESPRLFLDLIRETGAKTDAPIIDIGGGNSDRIRDRSRSDRWRLCCEPFPFQTQDITGLDMICSP